MCKGNKQCKSCNSIKIGSTMAKRRTSRRTSVTVTTEDVAYLAAGAVGGLILNKGINMALANQPEGAMKDTIRKAVPLLKLAAGGYAATMKGQKRMVRYMALGAAATGAIELGIQLVPEYASIAGTGNLYIDQIGSADPMLRLTADSSADYGNGGSLAVSGMYDTEELQVQ